MPPASRLPRDFIGKLAESVIHAHSLEQLVRPLLELLQTVTGLESTYLTTIDSEAGYQYILYSRNTSRLQIPEGLAVEWEGTLCKRALEENRPYTDDVANCWADSGPARELGIATYASTPVCLDDGSIYGTLCAASGERLPWADDAGQVMQMFSRLISQQVERERLLTHLQQANDSLAKSAFTDATTQLPNRRALMEELRRRLERRGQEGRVLLVAFVDLDQFKAINDTHGHDVGDAFLTAIGGRMKAALRADDVVARLGGDEFVVLSSPKRFESEQVEHALRERLQSATTGRFNLGGVVIDYPGPSIGTVVSRADETDGDALLARADAAMYLIKRERKARSGHQRM